MGKGCELSEMILSNSIPRIFRNRSGRILGLGGLAAISLVSLLGLAWLALLMRPEARRVQATEGSDSTVRIYCAAGVAKPVQLVAEKFIAEFGADVQIVRTGGSGELAGLIATEVQTGLADSGVFGADLFVSADDRLIDIALEQRRIAERFALARQVPVIAVLASSDCQVGSLSQLVDSGIRFGIASERAAVGRLVRQIAKKQGCLEPLEANKKTDAENVMTLAQSLVAGGLDAAIIWDTTVAQVNQGNESPILKTLAIVSSDPAAVSTIALGVVATSKNPTSALKFARYLTAAQTAGESWADFGFQPIAGDPWEEVPEVHLYFGSMFTPVLEESVRRFAQREGVNVYPRWEGCGKLVAAMKGIQDQSLFPDAYMACDLQFVQQVQSSFDTPIVLSTNELVLAVASQKKDSIRSVDGLAEPGLRIGICDPEQSALGMLTKEMFSQPPYSGWYDRLRAQASVTVDVGPTLVSQLLAGGLDVAIVYRSNVMADSNARSALTLVSLQDSNYSKATQSWTIAKQSKHDQLLGRLLEWITTAEKANAFRENGFSWQYQNSSGVSDH